MKLYCVTYKGKPVSVDRLRKLNGHKEDFYYRNMSPNAIVECSRKYAIAAYIHIFGFTWKERPKGVEIEPLTVAIV